MSIYQMLKKVILLYGLILIISYLYFRAQLINFSPVLAIFSILLFLAEFHTIIHFLGMVYSLWPRKYIRYNAVNYNRNLTVNLFICVCGEPPEIVKQTILAAQNTIKLYTNTVLPLKKPRIIVLNDGYAAKKDNWTLIRDLCRELNVYHIAREKATGFKAGNINNGLRLFTGTDPHQTIDMVFDADFSAKPEFLLEITKPFADNSVDFVQTPQRYKNEITWVAKAAAAHQIYFFDHICDAKAYDNALFLCGTNFAIRRSALDSVGGMDTRFITEDYATSLNLHMAGKKGVFINKVLALGIAPSTLKAYFSQQRRWSKGTFDTSFVYLTKILFGNLTLKQKMHYLLSATYYLIGVRDFILMVAPLPFLFFGISLIRENTLTFMTIIYGPMLLYNLILYVLLFKEPIKSLVLDIISFPVFLTAFLSSALKKDLAFIVTIKQYQKENIFDVYKTQLLIIFLLSTGLYVSTHSYLPNKIAALINYSWATFDIMFLSLGFFLILRENYKGSDIELNYSRSLQSAKSFFFPAKYILAPAFALILIFVVYKSPVVQTLLTQDIFTNVVAQAQGKTLIYEVAVPTEGVYYGYYIPSLNYHPDKPELKVIPAEKPSLTMFYQDWGERPGFDNIFINKIANANVLPVITWEPWDIRKVKDSNDLAQKEYAPKVIASGKYDNFIHDFAKDAAAYKKPFFLRFAHEMNGNWYPWGVHEGNKPSDYIAMWRHVHDIFVSEGATNAVWVWSPNNTDAYGNTDSIFDYYPGSNYVDWVAFSGFNWGTSSPVSKWTSFEDLARPAYDQLVKLNKPIMVAETSSASIGGDKNAWFEQTLKTDIPVKMPGIKAVIFFHDDSRGADFSLLKGMHTYQVLHDNIVNNSYYISEPKINVSSVYR